MQKRNLPDHLNNCFCLDLNPGNVFVDERDRQLDQRNCKPDRERSEDRDQSENRPRVVTVEEKVESGGEVGADVEHEDDNVEDEEEGQLKNVAPSSWI